MSTENDFDMDMIETLGPEFTVFVGLLLIMVVPNLGNGTFRIPGTPIRLPWFLGGTRCLLYTSDAADD